MRFSSIRYLIGEGFKNVWVHRLMSIASIGVLLACMLMMGIAIILSVNVDVALGNLEDQNVIMVFYSDELTDEQAQITTTTIAGLDNIKSAQFISREEGLQRQKDSMGNEYSALLDYLNDANNPLPNAAQVVIDDLEQFDGTIVSIKSIQGVEEINEQRNISVKLSSIRSMINNAGFWIVGLLLIISLAIVSNTIRITMFSRKLEINIMKAVGATNTFIRLPFMIEGMLLGIISGAVSTGVLYFIYKASTAAIKKSFEMELVPFSDFAVVLLVGFMLMGALTGIIASLISMGKYLKREGSEFNAIT